ncbi:hypothetical protein [Streptomyces sp. NPDC094437]|uniref:SCO2102 family sporulation regulator n=1 Tax=Streptomyces sp. NPDC094437 TaxID=3366060 RepID=UPI0037FD6620
MGWTVLYIAFGVVALWLLGEVLLQYKARLRWRLLAFGGFLGVVLGVMVSQVIVIGLGAIAFAVGQTYVTLSFRSGFASGWAVKRPGEEGDGDEASGGKKLGKLGKKRRRGEPEPDEQTPDALDAPKTPDAGHVTDPDFGYGHAYGTDDDFDRDDVFTPAHAQPTAAETTAVYEPQPIPDDTGSYGVYGDQGYGGQSPQDQYATAAQGADQGYAYDGYTGYDQHQYGYDSTGQQQYAAYSDPYIGTQTYGGYDAGYGQYDQQAYSQDQYANGGYGAETPPGGVWVPQQRAEDSYGAELPQDQQQYPYQGQQQPGTNGYDEQQYRF